MLCAIGCKGTPFHGLQFITLGIPRLRIPKDTWEQQQDRQI